MEMASAVLLNTMVPQQQPFWSTHQSNFASILSQQPSVSNFSEVQSNVCSIMPVMNYSMTPPPPVIQDRHSNHFQYQSSNIRSPLVSNSRPEEQFRFNDSSMPFIKYHRNNYNPRNTFSQIRTYNPNNRESNENRFSQLQRYRPYRSNYRPNFVRNEMNTLFESNNVITESNEREMNCDPAYRCRDIPVSENFIPLRKSQIKLGENDVQTVSDKEEESDDDDDDVIIIEEPSTIVEKRVGRQKRRFSGENNLMALKNKSAKKKKRNKKNKISEVDIIDVDDGLVMTGQEKNDIKTEPINTSTLMNENRISREEIRAENGIQEIKLEKDSLTVPLPKNNINRDQNDSPVFVKKESEILNPTKIKNENENLKVPKVENDFIKREEQEVTPNLESVSIKLESDSIDKIKCNAQVKVELDNCLLESNGNYLDGKISPVDKIGGIENEKLKGNDDVKNRSIHREDIKSQIPVEVEVVNHLLDEVENSLINNEIVVEKINSWSDLKKAVNEVQRVGMELTVKRDIHIGEKNEKNENTLDDQPLLKPHHCQTVDSILTKLQIFSSTTHKPLIDDKLKIMYDMYLPTATFRKTSPGLPAYRIVVMKSSSPVPSPGQILDLKSRFKDDIPVLIAIVMSDSVSYFFLTPISLPVQC
uniref:Uncharacterized protein n=1 Tax=Clastoptera arizonana TaxID=38151 RepID=A0A1B6DNI2_9HEMI